MQAPPPSGDASYAYPQQPPVYPQGYTPSPPAAFGSYPSPAGYPARKPYPAAGERTPDAGARVHDGFFLRFKVGIGAGGTRYEERLVEPEVSDVTTRGLSGNFELAIGGSLVENLAIHGNLLVQAMGSNKQIDGVDDHRYDRISTSMLILGGGATYYFMPANLFLTLVLGTGGLLEARYVDESDSVPRNEVRSGAGFGSSLSIGKEWWIGRMGEWGLGADITGTFITAPVRIGELSTRFLGNSISLNFSATFN